MYGLLVYLALLLLKLQLGPHHRYPFSMGFVRYLGLQLMIVTYSCQELFKGFLYIILFQRLPVFLL